MGVMMTREQIRYDHGPSFMLPFKPSPFDTAGRTMIIVEDPVTAKTVHTKTISPYQAAVHRSGIGFGPMNRCQNPTIPCCSVAASLAVEEVCLPDRNRRWVPFLSRLFAGRCCVALNEPEENENARFWANRSPSGASMAPMATFRKFMPNMDAMFNAVITTRMIVVSVRMRQHNSRGSTCRPHAIERVNRLWFGKPRLNHPHNQKRQYCPQITQWSEPFVPFR